MKLPISRISIFALICLLFQLSCEQKSKSDIENSTENESKHYDDRTQSQILGTRSGKEFEILTRPESNGMIDIHILAKGFVHSKDSVVIHGAEPLSSTFLADLDSNGFEELYLITTSTGSGSYGKIYGYASNSDKSVTPIYLPEPTVDDFKPEGFLNGYMGHDSIFLDQNKLMRKFPVYNEGDANCCPTGGFRVLVYKLIPGEAGWILEIAENLEE